MSYKQDLNKLKIGHPKHVQESFEKIPEYRGQAFMNRTERIRRMNGEPDSMYKLMSDGLTCRHLLTRLVLDHNADPDIINRDRDKDD